MLSTVMKAWPWMLLLVAVYCLVQIIRDYRSGNYLMAVAGGICLVLLVITPIQSYAVKSDVVGNS
jgi:hypothetical protein